MGSGGQLGRALLSTVPSGVDAISADRDDCDISDAQAIRELIRQAAPEIVLNAAAYTAVDHAESNEAAAKAVNADAVAAMVAALAEFGGRLVHVSTDFVFDGNATGAYRPDAARNPLSAYGRSKAAGEDHLRETDLLVRTSWVYAAGGRNFVRSMLGLMREQEAIGIVADQIGAPTWATGLAETIWALVGEGAQGAWHHCDAGVASWYDFAVAIQEEALALGLLDRAITIQPIATADYPTPAQRPAFSLLDCSKTRALLGDSSVLWRDNLRRMLAEEKALG